MGHAGRALLVAAIGACLLPASASAVIDDTTLVSQTDSEVVLDSGALQSTVSQDGNLVAFTTQSTDIGDADGFAADIFLRDLVAETTVHVTDYAAAVNYDNPSLSDDGCMLSFSTTAALDATYDNNGVEDVYVRDLCPTLGSTTLVSRSTGANTQATGVGAISGAGISSISGDGGSVVFRSPAEVGVAILTAGSETDGNQAQLTDAERSDVFVRRLGTDTTELVSEINAGGVSGNIGSGLTTSRAASEDGTEIAFTSAALDLVIPTENLPPLESDIFVRDFDDSSTTRVSVTPAGTELTNGAFTDFGISGDGNRVGFVSDSPELEGSASAVFQVYVRDRLAADTLLVSRQSGPQGTEGNSDSFQLSLSEDGRFVAFISAADNLTFADDSVAATDAFVRDTLNRTTFLISRFSGVTGPPGGPASLPQIANALEPTAVVFTGFVPLVAADTNGDADIYWRGIGEPPLVTKGASVNARPLVSPVYATLPGGGPVLLEHITQLPVGATIDTRGSRVEFTSSNDATVTQTAQFFDGVFKVEQLTGGEDVTTLELAGPLEGCPAPAPTNTIVKKKKKKKKKKRKRGRSAAFAQARAGTGRGLWGSGKGRFRTRGYRGSATVRGTTWFTSDLCDGSTLFQLTEGGPLDIDDVNFAPAVDATLIGAGSYVAQAAPTPPPPKKCKKTHRLKNGKCVRKKRKKKR